MTSPRTVAGIEIAHAPTPPVGREGDFYHGFEPGRTLIRAGHRKKDGYRPFTTDVIWERDVAVPTRDGTVLRADVFRPADSDENKVPILMAWSPYGKTGAGMLNLHQFPGRCGVPLSALSGYEKFEAPDPAEWVPRGYAVVEVDARGVFDSQGDIVFLGSAEGRDGCDALEFMADQPWSTGHVALTGNSWLAMAAYHIAAQQPPHLKCFAPLEGASDLFREAIGRGGIPQPVFWEFIGHIFSGRGQTESAAEMIRRYPTLNAYWADKRVDFSKVQVPTYVLGSWSSAIHSEGSMRCYQEINAPKWLTFHDAFEWYDLYSENRVNDLAAFFDHFLKGVDNGWEDTPRVRTALIGFTEPNVTGVPLEQWPAPATEYKRLYLSSNDKLTAEAPAGPGKAEYQSDVPALQMDTDTEELTFNYTFSERSTLLGYSKAELYLSCDASDDLDVFIQLRKADKSGTILQSFNVPPSALQLSAEEVPIINVMKYLGPTGMLRASLRELDPDLSKPYYPVPSLEREKKIPPGTIVKLEIGIWPGGIIFAPGESLVLKISGHPMILVEAPDLRGSYQPANRGKHVVHFGGEHLSYLQVPFVRL